MKLTISGSISALRGGLLLMTVLLVVSCASAPATDPQDDPQAVVTELPPPEALGASVDSLVVEEAIPTDESLLEKIVRTHGDLQSLQDLYLVGSQAYVDGDLDLAEQEFYLLKQGMDQMAEAPQDSLAVLYLSSLDRKVNYFVDILAEERFFSDSYAPYELSLGDAFDTLRSQYGIPEFLLPPPPADPEGSLAALLAIDNSKVDGWMEYFQGRGRPQFARWLERRARYGPAIETILIEEEMPVELLDMAMIESGLQSSIRSRSGAVGWWQFMRSTARNRGLQVDEWVDERRDIEQSTRAACRHMTLMHRMFQDWALAMAAYNAGEYRIQRAIGLSGDADYWELRIPRETRAYVPKFIAASRIARNPEEYGFTLSENPDVFTYEVLPLDDAYSLDQIAKATDISAATLRTYNPQLLFGVTPPSRSEYGFRVPVGKGETALAALTSIPEDERITWRKHRVRSGETLGAIARRYNTSVSAIMQINGITNARRVRAGRVLTIPYPRGTDGPVQVASANASSYRVQRGDTLVSISRRTRVSVSEIRRLNGLSGDVIHPGQTLTLRSPPPPAKPVDESTHEKVEYVVMRGDTLHEISRNFGVNVSDLLSWNSLSSAGTIFPGDKLDIWRPRTRAP